MFAGSNGAFILVIFILLVVIGSCAYAW